MLICSKEIDTKSEELISANILKGNRYMQNMSRKVYHLHFRSYQVVASFIINNWRAGVNKSFFKSLINFQPQERKYT